MAINPLVITKKITLRESSSISTYFLDISKIPILTPDEEYNVAMKSFNGDLEARELLIKSNLRFVVSVAKQYMAEGISLSDLINEGNYGLTIAAGKFDPTNGFKFISYAVWWIRRTIMEFLTRHSRTIKLPTNKVNVIKPLTDIINSLEQKYERYPTLDEILNEVGDKYSEKDINFVFLLRNTNTVSYDKEVNNDGESESVSLSEMLTTDLFPDTDSKIMDEDRRNNMYKILDCLPKDIHKIILIKLYGLDGNTPMSLKEIGNSLSLSSERVRQIRDKSLNIIRNNVSKDKLEFMLT